MVRAIHDVTTRINLRVALYARRQRRAEYRALFRDALATDPNPADLAIYLRALFDGWGLLLFPTSVLMIALAFIGNQLAGGSGNTVGLAVGLFLPVVCLAGQADAVWRYLQARKARRLVADGEEGVVRARRLVQIASVNDGGIALQVVAGLIATVVALSYY